MLYRTAGEFHMIGFYAAVLVAALAAGFIGLCIRIQCVPETLRLRGYVSRSWRKGQRAYILQVGTRRGPHAMGAGYIGGFTFYIAFNCIHPRASDYLSLYQTVPFCCGVTANGNSIPYSQG